MNTDRRPPVTYGKRKLGSTEASSKRRRVETDDYRTPDSSPVDPAESDATSTPPSSPPPLLPSIFKPTSGNVRKLVQMQLNLGVKMQRSCRECGMTYTLSSTEDAAVHRSFHERATGGIELGRPFRKAIEGRIVGRPNEAELICLIDCSSSIALRSRAAEVLNIAQAELGAVNISDAELLSDRFAAFINRYDHHSCWHRHLAHMGLSVEP